MTTIKQPSNNETMTTTHTPGPWAASYDGDPVQIGTADRFIGMTLPAHPQDATSEDYANATLMAAAPELLAALEGVIHHNDALSEVHKLSPSLIAHVSRAVAKARGEERA